MKGHLQEVERTERKLKGNPALLVSSRVKLRNLTFRLRLSWNKIEKPFKEMERSGIGVTSDIERNGKNLEVWRGHVNILYSNGQMQKMDRT